MDWEHREFLKQCLKTYEDSFRAFAKIPEMRKSHPFHAREYTRAVHEMDLPVGMSWNEVDQAMRTHKVDPDFETKNTSIADWKRRHGCT